MASVAGGPSNGAAGTGGRATGVTQALLSLRVWFVAALAPVAGCSLVEAVQRAHRSAEFDAFAESFADEVSEQRQYGEFTVVSVSHKIEEHSGEPLGIVLIELAHEKPGFTVQCRANYRVHDNEWSLNGTSQEVIPPTLPEGDGTLAVMRRRIVLSRIWPIERKAEFLLSPDGELGRLLRRP